MKRRRADTLSGNPGERQERISEIRMSGKTEGAPWNEMIIEATGMLRSAEPLDRLIGVVQLRLARANNHNIASALPLLENLRYNLNFASVATEAKKAIEEATGGAGDHYIVRLAKKRAADSDDNPKLVVLKGSKRR